MRWGAWLMNRRRSLLKCMFVLLLLVFISSVILLIVISLDEQRYGNTMDTQNDRKNIKARRLVHSVLINGWDTFVIFTHGIHLHSKYQCTVNGKEVPGGRCSQDAFICKIPTHYNVDDKAVLSLKTARGKILPSIAKWEDRFGMKDLGYTKVSLCIAAIVKNEEQRIETWLQYHLRQGVERFIIYDNNCTDNTISVITKYKEVIVIDWPWHKTQHEVFLHGILYTRKVCTWTLFNDVDEYVFPVVRNATLNVRELLTGFPQWIENTTLKMELKNVNQICFDIKVMGSSAYIKCPNKTISEAYIHFDIWDNRTYTKCAIKPLEAFLWTRIHLFKVYGQTFFLPREYSHIVHYRYQCWEYFMTKWDKGRAPREKDWDKQKLNRSQPLEKWTGKLGPVDTAFRDYKRRVDQWPLPLQKTQNDS